MQERSSIARELLAIEQDLKDLEIRYEQYFAGVEKREPLMDREGLAGKVRRLCNRNIVQTDLRFRVQNLASRFHLYCGHWDRSLRLLESGRNLRRHTPAPVQPEKRPPAAKTVPGDEVERIHQQLVAAYRSCQLAGAPPDRDKVGAFLLQQADRIREKFGDQEVEFRVEIEGGKPKIKVRGKR